MRGTSILSSCPGGGARSSGGSVGRSRAITPTSPAGGARDGVRAGAGRAVDDPAAVDEQHRTAVGPERDDDLVAEDAVEGPVADQDGAVGQVGAVQPDRAPLQLGGERCAGVGEQVREGGRGGVVVARDPVGDRDLALVPAPLPPAEERAHRREEHDQQQGAQPVRLAQHGEHAARSGRGCTRAGRGAAGGRATGGAADRGRGHRGSPGSSLTGMDSRRKPRTRRKLSSSS